jgi:hypothetical protein
VHPSRWSTSCCGVRSTAALSTDLGKSPTLSEAHRDTLRRQLLILRARQIRCIQVLDGVKCEGMARKGNVYCFHHDLSLEGRALRQRRNDHMAAAAKLRHWEARQAKVRAEGFAASTLGYVAANLGRPRPTSRRVVV